MPPSAPGPQRELDPRLILTGLPDTPARPRRGVRPAPRTVLTPGPAATPGPAGAPRPAGAARPVATPRSAGSPGSTGTAAPVVAPSRILPASGEVIDLRTGEELASALGPHPNQVPGRPDRMRPAGLARLLRSPQAAQMLRTTAGALPLAVVLGTATFFRFWHLSEVGYNSDEAVYAGTAASMAGHTDYSGMFPVFRAHPLLFQTFLSLLFRSGVSDWGGRALAAAFGVAAVGVTYALGRRLYGPVCGAIAGLLLAVMPYHVIVSRQVLLDGPMTLFASVTLYCLVRYCEGVDWRWMLAAGGALGITALSKETSVI